MFDYEGNLASMSSREQVREAHRQASPYPKERATWPLGLSIRSTRILKHPRVVAGFLIMLALIVGGFVVAISA